MAVLSPKRDDFADETSRMSAMGIGGFRWGCRGPVAPHSGLLGFMAQALRDLEDNHL